MLSIVQSNWRPGGWNIPMNKSKVCQSNGCLMMNRRWFCLVGKFCKLYLNAVNVPFNSAKRNAGSSNILANLWSIKILRNSI